MQIVAEADARYGAPNLRLDGGTALAAYHLGHRVSKDLDFFADYQLNAAAFAEVVREVAEERGFGMRATRGRSMGFAQFIASDPETGIEVQLDFAAASPFHLEERDVAAEGIRVSSYRDLCAGKLHAICDRYEPRDYGICTRFSRVRRRTSISRTKESYGGGSAPWSSTSWKRIQGWIRLWSGQRW